jgi:hypothetical protein
MKVWPFRGPGVFVMSDGTFPVSGFRWTWCSASFRAGHGQILLAT